LANELELKAVVADPDRLRAAVRQAGGSLRFRGLLRDLRLDREGRLLSVDQVLRVRRWIPEAGRERAEIGWKGPTTVNPEGMKEREEIEFGVEDGSTAVQVFDALGYRLVQAIDRFVELYDLDGTQVRIEWYPRMDVLVEIEGDVAGIERAIRALHLPRGQCLSEALAWFAQRFEERTGQRAVLAEADLDGVPPSWSRA